MYIYILFIIKVLMTNISFILVNSSMDSATSILLYIFPMSVMIQFLAAICISYYRRKYQKHDTKVYHIQLRLNNGGNADASGRNCETNNSFEVNTSIYNKIIFQVGHMLFIGLCLLLLFIIFTISLDKKDIHFVIRCSKDFAPGILLTVIIPIIFFARNKDAFYFVKSCLLCRQ